METLEKSNSDFSKAPTALGNPAKDAGFPHFPSHDGGGHGLPQRSNPPKSRSSSDSGVEQKKGIDSAGVVREGDVSTIAAVTDHEHGL